MILLSLYYLLQALKARRRHRHKTVKVVPVYAAPSPAELRRREAEARRQEKAQQEKELAAADLDRLQAEKQSYMRLLDAIETELEQTGNQKRIVSLLSKQASIESKLHGLDRKLDRAYMTARS